MELNKDIGIGQEPNQVNPNGTSRGDSTDGNQLNENQNMPKGPNIFNIILIFFLVTFVLNIFYANNKSDKTVQIDYSQFISLVESGNISEARLSDDKITIVIADDADLAEVEEIIGAAATNIAVPAAGSSYVTIRIDDPALTERFTENGVAFSKIYTSTTSSPITSFIMMWVIPTLLMYLIYFFFIRKMVKKIGNSVGNGSSMSGLFGGMGKSKAKEYTVEKKHGCYVHRCRRTG